MKERLFMFSNGREYVAYKINWCGKEHWTAIRIDNLDDKEFSGFGYSN
jgi:hypothetical protein